MKWVLIIGGSVIVYFLAWYISNRKKTELMSKGLIINRSNDFYKQTHMFTSRIGDFAAIASVIDRNVLGEQGISFEPYTEHGQIVFRNQVSFGSFHARLIALGFQNGLYYYRFQVEEWREGKYGITRQDIFGANVLLTAIERAFLRLDPETGATRAQAAYRTKPRLI